MYGGMPWNIYLIIIIYFRGQPSMNNNNTRYITDYLQSPCHILDFFTLSNSFFLFVFLFVFFSSPVFFLFFFSFILFPSYFFQFLFSSFIPFFPFFSLFFLFFFLGHYYHLHTEGVTQAGNSAKVSHCTAAINDKVEKLAQQ